MDALHKFVLNVPYKLSLTICNFQTRISSTPTEIPHQSRTETVFFLNDYQSSKDEDNLEVSVYLLIFCMDRY